MNTDNLGVSVVPGETRAANGDGPPKKLGHFELLEQIGKGGMGRVFRAWDTTLERQVALKLLDRSLADSDPQFVRDFIREAKSAAKLGNPHIVQIYFAGEDRGEYFIAMELLEGQSMAERLERGPMGERMVLRIARQIVEALAVTSAWRLIHGDIKPHNIFLTPNGDAKLLDFGLARKGNEGADSDGCITGSAAYISPERVRREPEDFRSDIYSLGATLFEALTGMIPFDAETPSELAFARLREDAPRVRSLKPAVSAETDDLVARMLAREPSGRPNSYGALLADIAAVEETVFPAPVQVPSRSSSLPLARATAEPAAGSGTQESAGSDSRRSLWRVVTSRRFLFISIAAHLLLGFVAAVIVVQTITAKRKLTFTSAPPSPNPSQRALEHKVQMAKKQNTMSAPAQPRRVTTTGLAKVALPDMPAMPTTDFAPSRMSGMGGPGFGLAGAGSGGGARGGGGAVPFFGLRGAGGLVGTFYDLKQARDGKPTDMAGKPDEKEGWDGRDEPSNKAYDKVLSSLIHSGISTGPLSSFFLGTEPLSTTQIYIPSIPASDGPKAFNLEGKAKPKRWVVVYRGRVTPAESGSYRFAGSGDDVLVVRLDGRIVLDASLFPPTRNPSKRSASGIATGPKVELHGGIFYNMEIVIGERPGGLFNAFLLIEKDGAQYPGAPKLPIFKLAPSPMPKGGGGVPEVAPDTSWSVWKAQPTTPLLR